MEWKFKSASCSLNFHDNKLKLIMKFKLKIGKLNEKFQLNMEKLKIQMLVTRLFGSLIKLTGWMKVKM